jgi:hypothetical protein
LADETTLTQIRKRFQSTGALEKPILHQVEPSFRSPSQYTFNPVLVAKIVDSAKTVDKA